MSVRAVMNRALERLTGRRLVTARPSNTPTPRSTPATLERRLLYQGIGELHRRDSSPPPHVSDLRTAELQVFSQNGEDGVLNALLRAAPANTTYFVEFGVQDGSECNTRLLAEVYGWSGLYIEPDPVGFDKLNQRYRRSANVACVQNIVTPDNINQIFESASVPNSFGVLSIDIDGQDYWVWKALSSTFRPSIVVVECNLGFPRGEVVVEAPGLPWSDDYGADFGASIEALAELGRSKGYRLVHVDLAGVNLFFVREDHIGGGPSAQEVTGILDRSPNYQLSGDGHSPSPRPRPTVDPRVVDPRGTP